MKKEDLDHWRRAVAIASPLLDLDEDDRHAGLACLDGEPEPVRRRVISLLRADDANGGVLDRPPAVQTFGSRPGMMIGSWQIGEEIGRGGMGLVYRASRRGTDFSQRAALKLLRVGMIDEAGVGRFQRERQILAALQHPSIASLIDGGVTDDGTPFLVMEEVDGEPIDRYCANHELAAEAIVGLVLQIADAVAYAHRRLIVHRDLKPENILVDANGRARLLDFGVAKLLDEGAPAAITTRILTPGYGAPEQLEGGTVTTATDVFGLGAVLYRLLAPTPSPDDDADAQPALVTDASMMPSRVESAVGGIDADLDNVVTMALRAEPERRYADAAALASELRKWLEGRPVEATPDRLAYRFRKYVARHRVPVVAALIAVTALVAGSAIALWQAAMARQESVRAQSSAEEATRQLHRAEAVTDFLVTTFAAADPSESGGREVSVKAVLDAAVQRIDAGLETQPETQRRLRSVLGEIAFQLGDLEHAGRLLDENIEASGGTPDARVRDLRFAARTASRAGDLEAADRRWREAIELAKAASAVERFGVELDYASLLIETRQAALALEHLERIAASPTIGQMSVEDQAKLDAVFALALSQLGRTTEAKTHAERSIARYEGTGAEHAVALSLVRGTLAKAERELGNLSRALELSTRTLEAQREMLGPRHPLTLISLNDQAILLKAVGRFRDSADQLSALLGHQRAVLGDDHRNIAITLFNRAQARSLAGDGTGAEADYRAVVARADAAPEAYGLLRGVFHALLGHCVASTGAFEAAEREMRLGLDLLVAEAGEASPHTARIRVRYAERLNDRQRHAEALEQMTAATPALEALFVPGSHELALARLEHGRALSQSDPTSATRLLRGGLETLAEHPFRHQLAAQIDKAARCLRTLETDAIDG